MNSFNRDISRRPLSCPPLRSRPTRPGNASHRNRSAFTLVELLVVIGIIALLVSILLPTLSKAREQANQVKCLNNLKQIGTAFLMYTNDNKGRFPFSAPYAIASDEDWLWWQELPVAPGAAGPVGRPVVDPSQSAIARYLGFREGAFTAELFRCPSDNVEQRSSSAPAGQGGFYRYSYAMNIRFGGQYTTTPRISLIRNSSEKVLLVEETPLTINDPHWSAPLCDDNGMAYPDPTAAIATNDLLSIIHDRTAKPDTAVAGQQMPNVDHRGNAAFVDGHAEFVPRSYAHNHRHLMPYE